jgi:nucleotide-binding universal stress UspA family protein
MKLVLPFDGSESAVRAVDYLIGTVAKSAGRQLSVELVNVQNAGAGIAGLIARDAADVAEALTKSCLEEGGRLLTAPVATLEKAKVAVNSTVRIGDPATEIAAHVDDHGADAIVMGTRGLGAVGGLVLGSVASKVVHLVKVPVTLIK